MAKFSVCAIPVGREKEPPDDCCLPSGPPAPNASLVCVLRKTALPHGRRLARTSSCRPMKISGRSELGRGAFRRPQTRRRYAQWTWRTRASLVAGTLDELKATGRLVVHNAPSPDPRRLRPRARLCPRQPMPAHGLPARSRQRRGRDPDLPVRSQDSFAHGRRLARTSSCRPMKISGHSGCGSGAPTTWNRAVRFMDMANTGLASGTLDELKATGRLIMHGSHHPILVVHDRGRVSALDNRCPHMGFPLDRGSVEDGILTSLAPRPLRPRQRLHLRSVGGRRAGLPGRDPQRRGLGQDHLRSCRPSDALAAAAQ